MEAHKEEASENGNTSPIPTIGSPPTSPSSSRQSSSNYFEISAPLALDVGGSFSKMVYWRPPNPPDLPNYIIKEFQDEKNEPKLPIKPDHSLRIVLNDIQGVSKEGVLKFLKFPSNKTMEFVSFVAETNLHEKYGPEKIKEVNATGGGAYKYAESVKKQLGITIKQKDEMQSLIRGLNFLLLNVENEAFTYDWRKGETKYLSCSKQRVLDPGYPFPYLLVNIGSGVSVLKVDSPDSFERVSGSSLGGGTFWGLCKLLTDIQSFDEVKELSNQGDNKTVDLIVGDIYGSNYQALGLGADVIASSLGKIATAREDIKNQDHRRADIVKSLLFMISNNIAQIGFLNAQLHKIKRIFFSGGFLQENEYVYGRFSYGVDFWSKGEMAATFLRHNSYLGALGALLE